MLFWLSSKVVRQNLKLSDQVVQEALLWLDHSLHHCMAGQWILPNKKICTETTESKSVKNKTSHTLILPPILKFSGPSISASEGVKYYVGSINLKDDVYWLFFKNGPFPVSFSLFSSFQYTVDSIQMFNIN